MAWNANYGSAGWHANSNGQSHFHPNNSAHMQQHYANAYYAQGGYYTQSAVPQLMQINVPSPGFARNQPMSSLVPIHMRNRVGPVRCGHEGCLFAGSAKEVEVHKMDRHLIFPPGWEENQTGKKRKRGKNMEGGEAEEYVDEEAQFRANGPIAIMGTDTRLDSPEAIAAWLEERKKRWPSAKRVAEKVHNRQEALERGQIIAELQRLRRSNPDGDNSRGTPHRGRGRGRGRGGVSTQHNSVSNGGANVGSDQGWVGRARGRGRGAGRDSLPAGERGRGRGRGRSGAGLVPSAPLASGSSKPEMKSPSSPSTTSSSDSDSELESDSSSDSDDGSGSDMDPTRDAVSSKVAPVKEVDVEPVGASQEQLPGCVKQAVPSEPNIQTKNQSFKKRTVQPPKPTYNPFDRRPNLLRNLLKPDIQATVSNLSQAIRFLVANDFLENVELKPGDAENVLVQPVDVDTTSGLNPTD